MPAPTSKRSWLSFAQRSTREKSRRRRSSLGHRVAFETLENRVLLARDFLEAPNNTFPGQTVEHLPGAGYIVDSYSTNASINPDGDVDNYNFRAAVAGEITVILRNQGGNPAGDANTAADDWIAGGDGSDPLLRGGNGNDWISGGAGSDRLLGDAGAGNRAYRDTLDVSVTGFTLANIFPVPANADLVQNTLDDIVDQIW